jgi:hypothetical protein
MARFEDLLGQAAITAENAKITAERAEELHQEVADALLWRAMLNPIRLDLLPMTPDQLRKAAADLPNVTRAIGARILLRRGAEWARGL